MGLYSLMHKNLAVAKMEISDTGDIQKVQISDAAHNRIPVGAQMNMVKFHEWWRDRATPKTRTGANSALRVL